MNLSQSLKQHGLEALGRLALSEEDKKACRFEPEFKSLVLVGNIGSSYWAQFSQSKECKDGSENPLDRWSKRVAGEISKAYDLKALFPFDGPPYYPFLSWAARLQETSQSPIGMLIHRHFGLWHSYRFALLLTKRQVDLSDSKLESPCTSCLEQPCLKTCPVNAFRENDYQVDVCAGYLQSNADSACHDQGCLARNACPVASEHLYRVEQRQFHLSAFISARNIGQKHRPET